MRGLLYVLLCFFASISVAQPIKGHINNSGVLNEQPEINKPESQQKIAEQSIYHYCAEFYITNYRECTNYLLNMPQTKANQVMSEYRLQKSRPLRPDYEVSIYPRAVSLQGPEKQKNVSRNESSALHLKTISSFVAPIGIITAIAGATILTLEVTSFPKDSEASKMKESLNRFDSNFLLSGSMLAVGALTSTIGIILSSSQE